MSEIKVIAHINPFNDDLKEYKTAIKKLSDIYDELGAGLDISHARMMIDDRIVTDFSEIPPEGSTVYIKVVPGGNSQGAGKGMGWAGAMMIIAGIVVSVVSWGTLGGVGVALIGSGVGLLAGGVALYNADIPSLTEKEGIETAPSFRGAGNQASPWGPVPVLAGRSLMYPVYAASNHTQIGINMAGAISSDGEDNAQYLVQLYCLGYSNINIDYSSIKIGDTSIIELSETKDITKIRSGQDKNIWLEVLQDGTQSSIYPRVYKETSVGIELKHDTPIIRTTTEKTTRISVDIYLPSGLGKYNSKGVLKTQTLEIIPEYKPTGSPDSAYQVLGTWTDSNVLSASTLKTMRYQIDKTVTEGQYDVRLRRITADAADGNTITTAYWTALRSERSERPVRAAVASRLTIIALKCRATDLLNGYVDQLNMIGQSVLSVYSGTGSGASSWGTSTATSNPASCYLHTLRDQINTEPMAAANIHWQSLEAWYTWCEDHHYECNAYITSPVTLRQLLTQIASTARAQFHKDGCRVGVIQDIARPVPVQLVTPRNSWGFSASKSFTDIPNSLHMQFNNAAAGYVNDERIVYDTGYGDGTGGTTPAVKSQDVSLWGVTDPDQAYLIGKYMYATTRLRPWIYTFNMDVEYLVAGRGSRILLSHDVPMRGKSWGRIRDRVLSSGKVAGFILDEVVSMESGKTYALRIRKSDDTLALLPVVTTAGDTQEMVLQTPLTQSAAPGSGDLFAFGETGQVTDDVIIIAIEPMEDLSAKITCVDYSEAIFGVDDPDYVIPAYSPSITVGGVQDSGRPSMPARQVTPEDINAAIASIIGGEADYLPADVASVSSVAEESGIRFAAAAADTGILSALTYRYQIKRGSSASWTDISVVNGHYEFDRSLDGYPEKATLDTWQIRCKAVNQYGNESASWKTGTINTDNYGTWIIPQPNILTRVNKRSLTLTMSITGNVYGNIRYKIQIRKAGETTWYKPNLTADPQASEDNYKNGSGHVITTEIFGQTVPLAGQDTEAPEDTAYQYQITSFNEKGDGQTSAVVTLTARATAIKDIIRAWYINDAGEKVEVDGALRAENIYTDNLAALCGAFAQIVGALEQPDNFWTGMDTENPEFRIGNDSALEESGDPSARYIHYKDGDLKMQLGSLIATLQETAINGSLNIYNADRTQRLSVSGDGLMFSKYNSTSGNYDPKGTLTLNSKGTLILTNDPSILADSQKIPRQNTAGKVYHFDSNAKDESGANPLGITATGRYENTSGVLNVSDNYLNGTIRKTVGSKTENWTLPQRISRLGDSTVAGFSVKGGIVAVCYMPELGSYTIATYNKYTGELIGSRDFSITEFCGILWNANEPIFWGLDASSTNYVNRFWTVGDWYWNWNFNLGQKASIHNGYIYVYDVVDVGEPTYGQMMSIATCNISTKNVALYHSPASQYTDIIMPLYAVKDYIIYEYIQFRDTASGYTAYGYIRIAKYDFSQIVDISEEETQDKWPSIGADWFKMIDDNHITLRINSPTDQSVKLVTLADNAIPVVTGGYNRLNYDVIAGSAEYTGGQLTGWLYVGFQSQAIYRQNIDTTSVLLGTSLVELDKPLVSDGVLWNISGSHIDAYYFPAGKATLSTSIGCLAFWLNGSVNVCGKSVSTGGQWRYVVMSLDQSNNRATYTMYSMNGTTYKSGTLSLGSWEKLADIGTELIISGLVDELWYDSTMIDAQHRGYMLDYRLPWGSTSQVLPAEDYMILMAKNPDRFQSNVVYSKTEVYNKSETDNRIESESIRRRISNCILEEPQNINLTLADDGTLTLHAGSVIYVPNGVGVYEKRTVGLDKTMSIDISYTGQVLIFCDYYTNMGYVRHTQHFSGETQPAEVPGYVWYDTVNNKIMHYIGSWTDRRSFPIAIVTVSGGKISSIDQVFQGIGYIGNTNFILPGTKLLCPDGLNADGTLKNSIVTISSVKTHTTTYSWGGSTPTVLRYEGSTLQGWEPYYVQDTDPYPGTATKDYRWYQLSANRFWFKSRNTSEWVAKSNWCAVGVSYKDTTRYTQFDIKRPVRLLTSDDKKSIDEEKYEKPAGGIPASDIADGAITTNKLSSQCKKDVTALAFPSNRFDDLTLGASDSIYTAPSDGWFAFRKRTNGSNQYIGLRVLQDDNSDLFYAEDKAPNSGSGIGIFVPVSKGMRVQVFYNAGGETTVFRFIYAKGAS